MIYDQTLEELKGTLVKNGWPAYKADIVYSGLYSQYLVSADELSSLSLHERADLKQIIDWPRLDLNRSKGKDTSKYRLTLSDGLATEMVVIPGHKDSTLCISSQVGCPLGCGFCATGRMGFLRDLTAGEIVYQVVRAFQEGHMIHNIVFMGMGEPLLNLKNVLKAIRILNDPHGLKIGLRRFTISTAGVLPGMNELMKSDLHLNLAISLNAGLDSLRSDLMPINRTYPLTELVLKAKAYVETTGRRVTFEYILLKGINDQNEHIDALIRLIRYSGFHLNLIPYNRAVEKYTSPDKKQVSEIAQRLGKASINVTVRYSKGADIQAACGMLASQYG